MSDNTITADGAPALGTQLAKATAWIVAGRLGVRLAGFINTLIIARILVPEDFGLVAIALATMQLLQNVTDFGIAQTMIKLRETDKAHLETLFTLSAARGVFTALILCLAAPAAATVYGDPRLAHVFLLVALYPLLTGLMNPRFFEFERAIDFSRDFQVQILAKLAEVATAILIALIFRSWVALILGLVAGGAVRLALSYAMKPWRPRLSLAAFSQVYGFMGWLTGISFAAALNNKLDAILLGRLVGPAGTGLYYVGFQLAELATRESGEPIARALYPGLASLEGAPARMRAVFLQGAAALAAITLPAAIGFALLAGEVVPLVLGEKWADAIIVIERLAPVLGLQSLLLATQSYAMALGRPQLVFWREVAFFCVRTPSFIFAALHWGLDGAVSAVALFGFVHFALNLHLYGRLSDAPFWEPVWAARRSLVAAAAMAGTIVLLKAALSAAGDIAMLALTIPLAGIVFAGVQGGSWLLERRPAGIEAEICTRLGLLGSR